MSFVKIISFRPSGSENKKGVTKRRVSLSLNSVYLVALVLAIQVLLKGVMSGVRLRANWTVVPRFFGAIQLFMHSQRLGVFVSASAFGARKSRI